MGKEERFKSFFIFKAMEELGAQVAAPIFLHQTLASRYRDAPPLMAAAKKRDLPYHPTPNFQQNWSPKLWDWDTVRFVAKPLDADQKKTQEPPPVAAASASAGDEDDERLRLNLGGGLTSVAAEEPAVVSRPTKRVRSGSPGSSAYPMCQVDNCKEDLSNAKDYHRRHKVCELHSKSTKALVAQQMQRFCQQCSR